ncbi:hypothetical protein [Candidatus Albibeggiatoa sp. nov. BB20]|uniref:hypothetical protein n=1 Tax=Candidatus Albibeggiatoa sp. nov. BB20 TaxID=3162723 RepID=UPI0033658390
MNYLENNRPAWNNSFIPIVEAGYTPKSLPQISAKNQAISTQVYEPVLEPNALPEKNQVNRRIEVQFPPDADVLSVSERKKIDGLLKTLELDSSQRIHILATPAPLKRDSVSSSHASKLRAQSIARVVYPYTQDIHISYHAEMKPNRVIIEFP